MSQFQPGDLIHDMETGALLLLVKMELREYIDDTAENCWVMMNLTAGTKTWLWEFMLCDEVGFKIVGQ